MAVIMEKPFLDSEGKQVNARIIENYYIDGISSTVEIKYSIDTTSRMSIRKIVRSGIDVNDTVLTYEKTNTITKENQFVVNDRMLTFHPSQKGKFIQVIYYASGTVKIDSKEIATNYRGNQIILDSVMVDMQGIRDDVNETRDDINKVESVMDEIRNDIVEANNHIQSNTNSIKNINLLSLNEGFINLGIDYPQLGLVKCSMIGEINELSKLQAYHDYLCENFTKATLYIPNGKIRIDGTFTWNTSKIQILCDGEIHYTGETVAIQTTSIPQGNSPSLTVYKQNGMVSRGLTLIGSGKGVGINICENSLLNVGTNRMSFDYFIVHSFATNIKTSNKAYLLTFNKLATWNADSVCVHIDSGVDSGENITFNECILFNSKRLLKCSNEFVSVFLNSCSLDYATQNFIDIEKGHVWCKNCHFESKQEYFYEDNKENIPFILRSYDGNLLDINGGWIVFQQKSGETNLFPMTYIFRNDRRNYINKISISNVLIQGFRCKARTLCDSEDGLVLLDKIHTYEWDRVVLATSKFTSICCDVNRYTPNEWGKRLKDGLTFNTPKVENVHGQGKHAIALTVTASGNGGYNICIPVQDKTLLGAMLTLSSNKSLTTKIKLYKYVVYQNAFVETDLIKEMSVDLTTTPQAVLFDDRQVQLAQARGQVLLEISLDGLSVGSVVNVGDCCINVC